ncbi:ABC-2 transporter permease [Caproiciproducens sp. MSJ-32]|uniref:ABC-2 transporter permease n=1 Tax=Caproiciproducens sp. MSJ-32 TaxID=2841527 RepID=UPI002ED449F3
MGVYKLLIYFEKINNNDMVSLEGLGMTMVFIGVFMMCIVTPLELLLGFEKGRFVIVFLSLSPMIFGNLLLERMPLINLNSIIIKILILLCLITIILISYFITSNLYAKKEM